MIPYKKTQLIEYLKTRFLDLHKLDIELLEKKIYRKIEIKFGVLSYYE